MSATTRETPYHGSRVRVLRAYRAYREQGYAPPEAISQVLADATTALVGVDAGTRGEAELEWDREHARRYRGWLSYGTRPSWPRTWRGHFTNEETSS
jgi:hypothetical protein